VTQRKNLKDFEPQRDEHLRAIAKATDFSSDVTAEADWVALAEALTARDPSDKDKVGKTFYDWYLGGLAKNLEKVFGKDEIARKSLHAVWTTGVIRLELRNVKTHTETAAENGDLVIAIDPKRIGSNYISCGDDLLGKLSDASGLSTKAAQDVKENEAKRDAHLLVVRNALNLPVDVTLDIDLVAYAALVDKAGKKDRVGQQIFDWLLERFAENMVALATKDDMYRDAICEAWTTGVLRFQTDPKIKEHACDFVDGNLIITSNPDRVTQNHMSIGKDIEGKL
jgi:hypothetical protein